MNSTTRRIAMWSGPRNISTAMMRAWENRADCVVADEPFYACYLAATGLDHPGREAVLASQPTGWREVAETLTGPPPGGAAIFYQKHMAHHLLPHIGRDWLAGMSHAFLIRPPEEVAASYVRRRGSAAPADLGFEVQAEIYRTMAEAGAEPPVVRAEDVLRDPPAMLKALCGALDIPFDPAMLSWPAGPRASDGVWAKHWYARVERSTGFAPWRPFEGRLDSGLQAVADACRPAFAYLEARRLRP